MPRRPKVPKRRVQYDVTEKQDSQIEELMELLRFTSVAECLRGSVRILLRLARKVSLGYEVELVRRQVVTIDNEEIVKVERIKVEFLP